MCNKRNRFCPRRNGGGMTGERMFFIRRWTRINADAYVRWGLTTEGAEARSLGAA